MKYFDKKTIPYWIMGILAFVYVLSKAYTMNIVGDEAYTIMRFVPTWIVNAQQNANNHYINSFLIKIFYFFFDDTGFVARLPTVLSFLLYLYFGYRIASQLSLWTGYFCFFLLIANPFLLEFFSLARGYGLSLAFMMASLYYAIENVKSFSTKTLLKSLIWAGISVLSIFSMIYFWIALGFTLNLIALLREEKQLFKKGLRYSFWIGFILCCLIVYPILQIMAVNDLEYGGTTNVVKDTIASLLQSYIGGVGLKVRSMGIKLTVFLSLFLLLSGSTIVLSYYYNRNKYAIKNFLLFFILSICVLLTLAFYIADIRYPLGRNALFLWTLFVLLLTFNMEDLKKHMRYVFMGILTISVSGNLLNNLILYKTIAWPSAAPTTQIFDKISSEMRDAHEIVYVGHTGYFYNAFNYYTKHAHKKEYAHIELAGVMNGGENRIEKNQDYYVLYFNGKGEDGSENPDIYFNNLLVQTRPTCYGKRIQSFPNEDVFVYKIICTEK